MRTSGDAVEWLPGLGPAHRRAMSAALCAGRLVGLELVRPAPRGVRLDEWAPLLAAARAASSADQTALDAFRAPAARPLAPGERRPGVTVVVPSHRRVPVGLRAFLDQDLPVRVLVLSNGPEGPVRAPGAEVRRVRWMGHGATRQQAVRWVTDPYVFFTVDDAIPLGRGFLRELVEALADSPYDAMVARQVPWPDADPITRARLRDWTPPGRAVHTVAQVDHVGTLHRTATLRRHPLPDVPIAEDAWWSIGRHVGYAPRAPLLHSHPRAAGALYRRNRDIHAQLVAMGRPPTVAGPGALLGALPGLIRPMLEAGATELPNLLAEVAGQWVGARRGRRLSPRTEAPS